MSCYLEIQADITAEARHIYTQSVQILAVPPELYLDELFQTKKGRKLTLQSTKNAIQICSSHIKAQHMNTDADLQSSSPCHAFNQVLAGDTVKPEHQRRRRVTDVTVGLAHPPHPPHHPHPHHYTNTVFREDVKQRGNLTPLVCSRLVSGPDGSYCSSPYK